MHKVSKKMSSFAERVKQWLEETAASSKDLTTSELMAGEFFSHFILSNLTISHFGHGHIRCSLRIPPHLTDEKGNWQSGAIAALIDDVGACSLMASSGHIYQSVDFSISYFSPPNISEAVEIDAKVTECKKKVTAVTVEVRKKGSGALVAVGRQWMGPATPLFSNL